MKISLPFLWLGMVLLLSSFPLKAQNNFFNNSSIPLKSHESPAFGKDIVINNNPLRDQRNVSICSAFNGWLYACYWTNDSIGNGYTYYVFRSTDQGITWNLIYSCDNNWFSGQSIIKKIEIAACGTSENDIKYFLSAIFVYYSPYHIEQGACGKFNGITGEFEDILLDDESDIHDIALLTDGIYPAGNSNPYSIAILYSRTQHNYPIDDIVFCSSSNGGLNFDHTEIVKSSTTRHYSHVNLAYGRSSSKNSGRYYAVWEDKLNASDTIGHIYTAHTEPGFNSLMTTPVCLDSLNPNFINKCRKPVISCQADNANNDSSDITQVASFEVLNQASEQFQLAGFYNKRSTTSTHFTEFSFGLPNHYNDELDIAYNPYSQMFMGTFYDSTTKKLPYIINDVNLTNPDHWNQISTGYNDVDIDKAPFPRISTNYEAQNGVCVWNAKNSMGNGVSMFDAPYSVWTGTDENQRINNAFNCKLYPNPCDQIVHFDIKLDKPGRVIIKLYTIVGEECGILIDEFFTAGKHLLNINISKYSSGGYLYFLNSGYQSTTGKLYIVR
ncbi:MAG: hypothetical protein Q8867_04110 [Bacteroidota bacterium]|nr:hypothetical protein [Bacteroidota bacterium]